MCVGGGGGRARGWHRIDFFSSPHLLCTIKSQMGVGAMWAHGVNGGGGGGMPLLCAYTQEGAFASDISTKTGV